MKQERGFAMLLVFAMAAAIAIMLYMQLPRAAFEAQRAKEELLQERGEQYIRAIQLYVAKWRSYPPDMDALERTNNVRFLRRRYKDPMTGKDEWRLIHVNAAGQLIDSIVQKKTDDKKQNQNTFITEMATVGSTVNAADAAQNIALRRRASDQNPLPQMGGPTPPIDPQALGNGAQVGAPPANPNDPNQPQQPGQFQQQQQPGQFPQQQPGEFPQQQPGQFPQQQPGQFPQQQQPGQFPQQPSNQQQPVNPSGLPYPVPPAPGTGAVQPANPANPYPTQPATSAGVNPSQNQGLELINSLLRQPRQNVPMGIPGAPGLQIGGGLAGVATKFEAPSIKIYNERQKYNEWEFIYDTKKDKRLVGAAAGITPQQPQNLNPLGNTNPPNPTNTGGTNTGGGNSFISGGGGSFIGGGGGSQPVPNPVVNPGQQPQPGQQQPQPGQQPQNPFPNNPNFPQPGKR